MPKLSPRLVQADRIGKVAKRIWRRPLFAVRLKKNVTEFVFTLPYSIPGKIKEKDELVHGTLFGNPKIKLSQALLQSYTQLKLEDGKRPVAQVIGNHLYQVFVGGLQILLGNLVDELGPEYNEWQKEQSAKLPKMAKRKSGPKTSTTKKEESSKQRAIMCANLRCRYDELFEQIKMVRVFLKERRNVAGINVAEVKMELKKKFSFAWISLVTNNSALQNIYRFKTEQMITGTLIPPDWTCRELALKIIDIEEKIKIPEFCISPKTLYENYICALSYKK